MKGNSTGGTIPLGYKVENGKLVEDEKTAHIARLIFERYASGVPKTSIAKELNDKGYRTRRGSKFTANSFSGMLTNKKYIGINHYDDIETDTCPALISVEIFNKCAQRAEQNKKAAGHNKAKIEYLLSGKLFCGHCGSPMTGESGRGKSGNKYYYYTCSGRKKKTKKCDKKREAKDFIEWYITEQTVQYVLAPERIEKIAGRVVDKYKESFSADMIKDYEKKLTDLEREYSKLADALVNTTSKKMIETINSKASLIEIQIEDIKGELQNLYSYYKKVPKKEEIVAWLKSFCSGDVMDNEFRRRIIDVLVNAIYLFDNKVVIYYNVKGGKQVSYIEALEDLEKEFESSYSERNGPPRRGKSFWLAAFFY